ncbi:MAG: hypothetical protein VX777_06100 [Chlamydiota bacterium]|nr:hypothetical protein [Chlamydiota bacterium]
MVILKQLKKQIHQFVTPEIEPLVEEDITFYQHHDRGDVDDLPPKNTQAKQSTPDGYDELYTFETIDVKTIRPLGAVDEDVADENLAHVTPYRLSKNAQLQLELGGEFRSYIDSFVLNEPIHVLDISPQAVKGLLGLDVCFIRDLITTEWYEAAIKKGVGQGHIDEIHQAISSYLSDKVISHCEMVDFESWIRSLIPEDQKSKVYLLLKEYSLGKLIPLTPAMNVEIKRMSKEDKLRCTGEAKDILRSTDRTELSRQNIMTISDVFVTPWLRERCGIARQYEIFDRLEQISENPHSFRKALSLLCDLYSGSEFLFEDVYPSLNRTVIFVDMHTFDMFIEVEKVAYTYFTSQNSLFGLTELVTLIGRELAVGWRSFDSCFIEKVLRNSDKFLVYKDTQHNQVVTLS